MNVDPLIKKAIEFSRIKIIKFFFQIIEAILFWYYSKTFKKRKKNINGKFFSYLQLFLGSKVHALYRRKRHEILSETLDPNSKIKATASEAQLYSDATMIIYNSKNIAKLQVEFKDMFPTSLSALEYSQDATDVEYFKAAASFRYLYYEFTDI